MAIVLLDGAHQMVTAEIRALEPEIGVADACRVAGRGSEPGKQSIVLKAPSSASGLGTRLAAGEDGVVGAAAGEDDRRRATEVVHWSSAFDDVASKSELPLTLLVATFLYTYLCVYM